jgi:hypothetical protein
MANVSVAVEIETRTEHDLSTVLQGVADDQSVNVGTLVARNIIELATSGERDAERLCASVLATYKPATG